MFEVWREIDDKCIKKTKKINNNVSNKKTTNEKSEDVSNKVVPENKNNSFEERLKKLKSLYDQELITKEEYDAERKEVLDEM